MTWGEWCNSSYNIDNEFYLDSDGFIMFGNELCIGQNAESGHTASLEKADYEILAIERYTLLPREIADWE